MGQGGRLETQAPDVDGVVFLDENSEWVEAGMFVEVEIHRSPIMIW